LSRLWQLSDTIEDGLARLTTASKICLRRLTIPDCLARFHLGWISIPNCLAWLNIEQLSVEWLWVEHRLAWLSIEDCLAWLWAHGAQLIWITDPFWCHGLHHITRGQLKVADHWLQIIRGGWCRHTH